MRLFHVKDHAGVRVLTTKSPTTAINEARFYSSFNLFGDKAKCTITMTDGSAYQGNDTTDIVGVYQNGKKI